MMFVVAIPSINEIDRRFLAGTQYSKNLAFSTGPGGKFVKAPVDFIYVTNPKGTCPYHSTDGIPDVLRKIADHDIGGNAPQLADELYDLAYRIEKDMSRE